jgi:hypothetical protein
VIRASTLSVDETDRIARVIERDFELLPDSRDGHDRWRQLLFAAQSQGRTSAKGAARTAKGIRNCSAPHSVLREFLKSP